MMGKQKKKLLTLFTKKNVLDKFLVIRMLRFEEIFTKSSEGQVLYKNPFSRARISLDVEHSINRITLDHFNFDTSDVSVAAYRTIFRTYFNAPDDYDKEVINSVHYMRENKCMFYTKPILEIGQTIPDCELVEQNGEKTTSLHAAIKKEDGVHTVFAAFSTS